MKAIITLLLSAFFLPVALSAQSIMTENEFYNTGDVIQMVNCNANGVSAGNAGANMTWDFSTLMPSGGMSITSILQNNSGLFSTAGLIEIMPNGTVDYLDENSAKSYIDGSYDSATNTTIYYANYEVSKRPFSYGTSYVDTYYVNIPSSSTNGAGYLTETGDSYGTLTLPTGTFSNVLRIRKVQQEIDTTGASSLYTITVSYLWFDSINSAPLLRIDSISSVVNESQDVMYLYSPVGSGISIVNKNQNAYSSYFDNSGNLVVNGFETEQNYEVALYNIIGSRFFLKDFSTTESLQRFDIGRPLSPGIYLVSITNKNRPGAPATVLKVVKSS